MRNAIRIFSYAQRADKAPLPDGITPMFQAGPDTPAVDVVKQAIEYFSTLPADRRWLYITHGFTQQAAFKPAEAMRDGLYVPSADRWAFDVYTGLRAAGIVPAVIYFDQEGAEGLSDSQPEFGGAWDKNYFSLRRIICEGLRRLYALPFLRVYGRLCPMVNWSHYWPTFPTFETSHGWPMQGSGVLSDWSSPEAYVGSFGGYEMQGRETADPRNFWNAFVAVQNHKRACRFGCMPTISPRNCVGGANGEKLDAPKHVQWLWEQDIRHSVALGISDFVLWNPNDDTNDPHNDDQALADLVKRLKVTSAKSAGPIPLDAAEVRTGAMVTTQAQYLRRAA